MTDLYLQQNEDTSIDIIQRGTGAVIGRFSVEEVDNLKGGNPFDALRLLFEKIQ